MPDRKPLALKIFNNIRRVFQVFHEQSKKAETEAGITGPQLWAIKIIGENPGLRITELAALMYHHPATIGGILDRLEARGLVKRVRSFRDRRVTQVELTNAGKETQRNFPEIAQGMLAGSFEEMPIEKLLIISVGLEELVKILGAKKVTPQPILAPEDKIPDKKRKKAP